MKHQLIISICRLLLFLCGTFIVNAQTTGSKSVSITLPEVALLDIEPNNETIILFLTAPSDAGMPLNNPNVNTTKWINYSSAISSIAPHRTITAEIDQEIPSVSIRLQASNAIGGNGTLGTSTGQVVLTTSPQTIINGIGGAYTGDGANNGHQLSISAEISNYEQLIPANNQIITITYTISN